MAVTLQPGLVLWRLGSAVDGFTAGDEKQAWMIEGNNSSRTREERGSVTRAGGGLVGSLCGHVGVASVFSGMVPYASSRVSGGRVPVGHGGAKGPRLG